MIELPTEAEPVRVIQGDCLSVLRELPDGCVDAVVTDPPYNVGFDYRGDDSGDCKDDYEAWCAEWFAELRRVCSGGIAISTGTRNVGMWERIQQPSWWMCWHKPAAMGRSPIGFNNWEPIAVYGKPHRQGCDVIEAQIRPDPDLDGHPCPKPLKWGRKLVDLFCPPGGIVLEPFGGSGTVATACVIEHRRCLSIEREPAYCDIARRRVAEAMGTGLLAGIA
jgi:site-specific DNA-methyltransferase (adenine-specific)